ncbi:MAG TPA: FkbM family methyltransferase [Puia sp.]
MTTLLSKWLIVNISLDEIFQMAGASAIKTFVEIGANDGKKNDPLYHYIVKYGWTGILVEPDPANFKKLKANYQAHDGLIFENTGIGPERGEMPFYKIKDISDREPGWYDQVGSFDKKTFLKNITFGQGLDQRMIEVPLPVIGFDELLEKNNFGTPDLLHLDAEGFDFRILRSIDFKKYQIRLVLFESEWMTKSELKELIQYLMNHQYRIVRSGIDYAGIKNNDSTIKGLWKKALSLIITTLIGCCILNEQR